MEIFGKHTAAAEKNLSLSPYQINCGHRIRVLDAAEILRLKNVKRHDLKNGGTLVGRTVLLEGDYNYAIKDKMGGNHDGKIRIAVMESQMGMSATEITQKEYACHAEKVPIGKYKHIYQIRVGTALGINPKEPIVRVGHIVMPDNNVFFSGAALQSCGYTPILDPSKLTKEAKNEAKKFLEYWESIGGRLTKDGKYLVNKNNPTLLHALSTEAARTKATHYVGGCFSKDSLYGERGLSKMVMLGRQYRVITSEMEQGMNAYIAGEAMLREGIRIMTGAVLVQIGECWIDGKGAVHGHGFPETKKEEKSVAAATKNAFVIAANALARMKEKLEQPLFF